MEFKVRALRADGSLVSMPVEAPDLAAALQQARSAGLSVLSARAAGSLRTGVVRPRRFPLLSFCQELVSLLEAGLSLPETIEAMVEKESRPEPRRVLARLRERLFEGQSMSRAMEDQPQVFPPLLVATVGASEQTGDLGVALRRYADHQQSVKALRDKVVGAAVYPLLLLAVGFGVVLFLLGVVVPKFAVLIESSHAQLPWTSQLMMSWGRLVAAHIGLVGACGAALLAAVVMGARRVLRTGARGRWIEAMPFVGSTIRQFRHAQLYRTTGMLVQGGIPAPRALGLSTSLLGEADQERLRKAIVLLREGRSVSGALDDAGLADPVAASMLTVAERTGALPEILERIAQFHESGLQRSVELTTRLFEPILMVGIGLVVGAIIVMMYLPIFDLASSLQ